MKVHIPRTPQDFWCSECDRNSVDSTKPETGTYYTQFGHSFDRETGEYDGEYVGVMFAICKYCADSDKK